MTPEQMREAAAMKAIEASSLYFDREYEIYCRTIAARIRAIPLTAPEPTMRDRIADVLHDQHLRAMGPIRGPQLDVRRASGGWASVDARKVLEVMRKPTEAMVGAGTQCTYSRDEAIDTYRAMIDAALAEK